MGIWKLARSVRGLVLTGIVLQGLGALAGLVPLIATVELVRTLIGATGGDALGGWGGAGMTGEGGGLAVAAPLAWRWLWIAVAGVAVRFALVTVGLMLTHAADARLGRDLRVRLVTQLERLPMGDAAGRASGAVKKLVTDDVNTLHSLVAHAGGDMLIALLTAVAGLTLLITYSWQLALLALVPLVAFVLIFGALMGTAAAQFHEYDAAKERVNAATVEFSQGIAVVKTYGRAGQASDQFRQAVNDCAAFFASWMGPMIRVSSLGLAAVSVPSVLAVMTIGGLAFLSAGWIGPVEFAAGLVFGIGLALPLAQLDSYGVRLRAAREAATHIGAFLSLPAMPVPDPDTALQAAGARCDYREVRFRYTPDGHEVVRNLSLRMEPGTVTALVGPSGSGKSTIASLLPRFWDLHRGTVSIGGADVREQDRVSLYASVGFVFQGARLVPLSVLENLRIGRPAATRADVEDAARAAHMHEQILALPRGYESVVGVDALFSGGETQRLAVARALLDDAPVLVLDEPTSFADPENEVLLQRAITRATEHRTVLMIAHRLETIAGADQIAVISRGELVEQGTHTELMAQAGLYRQLWHANGGHA